MSFIRIATEFRRNESLDSSRFGDDSNEELLREDVLGRDGADDDVDSIHGVGEAGFVFERTLEEGDAGVGEGSELERLEGVGERGLSDEGESWMGESEAAFGQMVAETARRSDYQDLALAVLHFWCS